MDTQQLSVEAKFFKGLGDKSRLAILETLSEEEKTVADIVKLTGLSQPNVSAHLSCLLECGLVKRERDKKRFESGCNDGTTIFDRSRAEIRKGGISLH